MVLKLSKTSKKYKNHIKTKVTTMPSGGVLKTCGTSNLA